jgi:Disulphide bond corrector protein DsbC
MKQIFTFLTLVLLTSTLANAQSAKQVKWVYTVKKIADKTYEVSMSATVGSKYHIYSQDAGAEGPLPTTFNFTKNPLVSFEGKVKETGKLIKKNEEVWGGVVNYYENSVNFIQVVKLKSNIKTNIAGKVSFIVCNDRECLAPSDVDFSVAVGG